MTPTDSRAVPRNRFEADYLVRRFRELPIATQIALSERAKRQALIRAEKRKKKPE